MSKRKTQFMFLFIVVSNVSMAQWGGSTSTTGNIYRDGNVGIGTTNPSAKLEIVNSGNASFRVGLNSNMANAYTQLLNSLAVVGNNDATTTTNGAVAWNFYNNGSNPSWSGTLMQHVGTAVQGNMYGLPASNMGALLFQNVPHGVIASNSNASIHISPNGNLAASFLANGKIGFGTSTPSNKLTIVTNDPSDGIWMTNSTQSISLLTNLSVGQWNGLTQNGDHMILWKGANPDVEEAGALVIGTWSNAGPNGIRILPNGNVGIGTWNPGTSKLAVEGKIVAREVRVTLATPFPDYVFGSNYRLRNLDSLKNYIDQNKHLPGIPSAAEVEKNGGIELGKISTQMLEKIEELTLYVIELNKKVQKLEMENQELRKKQLQTSK